jgi:hypothetical protein
MAGTALKGNSHTFANPFLFILNSCLLDQVQQYIISAKENTRPDIALPVFVRFTLFFFTIFG